MDFSEESKYSRSEGEYEQARQLFEEHYNTLKRRAHGILWRDFQHTVSVTGLVHEAFLKLSRNPPAITPRDNADHGRLIEIACRAMRQFLVDRARHRQAIGRAEAQISSEPVEVPDASHQDPDTTLAINAALEKLEQMDERAARMVELRYFGGLDWEETAEALGVSPRTLQNQWTTVRMYLLKEIKGSRSCITHEQR